MGFYTYGATCSIGVTIVAQLIIVAQVLYAIRLWGSMHVAQLNLLVSFFYEVWSGPDAS